MGSRRKNADPTPADEARVAEPKACVAQPKPGAWVSLNISRLRRLGSAWSFSGWGFTVGTGETTMRRVPTSRRVRARLTNLSWTRLGFWGLRVIAPHRDLV